MKGFFKEFKEFATKGSVVDLAVGVIIGGAFNKIVTSLVNDIVMPLLSLLIGKNIFSALNLIMLPQEIGMKLISAKEAAALTGEAAADLIYVNIGTFLQTSLDFILMALCIFIIIKIMGSLRKTSEKIMKNKEKEESKEEKETKE